MTKKLFLLVTLALWAVAPWSTTALAQNADKNVTLDMNQVTVKEFFAAVKKQTGLNFIYSGELAKSLPKVSVKAKNKPVKQVLSEVMNRINCSYEIEGSIVTITRKLSGARTRTVTGYVKDDTGEPLPGVSICIDDSKVCTITDINGFYTLKVPATACDLKYSFVGMDNAIVHLKAGNALQNQDVTMLNNNQLEEVVVTGYQDISKPKMTGSVTTISADKLNDRYMPSLMSNLEGRVAGLSTYGGKMTIRGTSSLYAESSPLLVVDGLPVEGSIDDLNPYDIESVNVLKDAAAAAIYGARASAGIIVVTTKNAKKQGKIDIDFSANLTVWENKNMDYHDNFYLDAAEQVDIEAKYYDYYFNGRNLKDANGVSYFFPSPIKGPQEFESTITSGNGYISPIQYAYYQKALGNISEAELQNTLNALKKNNYAKEYGDAVYKQQVLQQYNLSLRGRSDKIQNNLILNYKANNQGIINNMYNNLNIQYKGIYNIAKWLTGTFTVNGIFEKKREAGYDYISKYDDPWAKPAYESLYNTDGSYKLNYYSFDGNAYYTPQYGLADCGSNPLEEYYNNTQTTHRQYLRYHGELHFNIIDGLTAQAQFVYEKDHTTVDWLATQESHAMRMMKNAYATYDASSGTVSFMTPESGGMLSTRNTDGRYWTARGQLNYNKTLGKHEISALAGMEFRETHSNGTKTLLLGYDDQLQISSTHTVDLGTLRQMDSSPYYMITGGRAFPAHQYVYSPYIENNIGIVADMHHKYASGYFNATYTYDSRYNVFGSFRKDYADVYGLNAKFRGKPLWSVGAGWLINNEAFMKEVSWVNFLKLRISYGVTGNIYQGATSYMTASSGKLNQYTNQPYGTIESPANPNLKWEQNRTTNIGVDFSLLNNRLRGAVDYYNKVGKDIFAPTTLDPTTGFSTMVMNVASMKNNGIELQLTYDWLRAQTRESFGWTTNLTLSYNKNKITEVENPSTRAWQLYSNVYVKGYPTSALWSHRFAGIDNQVAYTYSEADVNQENPLKTKDGSFIVSKGGAGETLWYTDNDNKVHEAQGGSVETMEYSGQSEPKTILGIDNTFHWKGFSLGVLLAYYGGHMMRALQQQETFNVPPIAIASYFSNAWDMETNPNSTVPGIGLFSSSSTGWEPYYANIAVHKADFLKVRNIVMSYDFPSRWITPLGINRLSLRFQIDNPKWLWIANDVNVDPETLGIRQPSSFIFGLNINL